MDIETITKLLDAGYTKADIDAMQTERAGGEVDKAAGENAAAEGKEQGDAASADASKIAVPVDFGAAIENLTNTVAGLKDTVKALQDANAGKAATDKPKKGTVDEVMKSFIDKL